MRILEPDKDLAPARLRAWTFLASGDSPSESSLSCSSTAQFRPIESTLGARAAAAMAAGVARLSSRVVVRVVVTSCGCCEALEISATCCCCCCCDTRAAAAAACCLAIAIALGSLPSCATMSSSKYPLLIPSLGSRISSYQELVLLLYRLLTVLLLSLIKR